MKLKETPLEKKTKTKTDHCTLLPINKLYGGYIKGFGKETGEFSHHVFCGKLDNIAQKQTDSMFYLIKAKKIDKNNIYTYITKLTLIKMIACLVYLIFQESVSLFSLSTVFLVAY